MSQQRFHRLGHLRKSNGFSLVEVMVVTGILGVLAMGAAQLFTNMNKMNSGLTSSMTITGLQHDLLMVVGTPSLCATALTAKTLNAPLPAAGQVGSIWSTTPLHGQDIQFVMPGSSDTVGGGADVASYTAVGTHIYLSNGVQLADDALGNHVFMVRMNLSTSNKVGFQLAPRLVGSITVSQNPGSGKITTCGGMPVSLHQNTCYQVGWGSKNQNTFPQTRCQNGGPTSGSDPSCVGGSAGWCKPGDYMAGFSGTGITTGAKRDFGVIFCCTPN